MTAFSVPTLLWRNLQPDGSVIVPDVLRPYMGRDVISAG